jgi:hypothetical protein
MERMQRHPDARRHVHGLLRERLGQRRANALQSRPYIAVDPFCDFMRSNPRFATVIRRLALPG